MALRIGFAFNEKPSEEEEPPSSASHDRFAEWDDPETIAAVADALALAGTVIPLEADDDFPQRLRDSRPDIVFNIAEGLHGPNREAHVPAICEFYGIPYTGSDLLTLALGLDKRRAKEVMVAAGVATPRWTVPGNGAGPFRLADLSAPFFVKPLFEGSSKGIDVGSLCLDLREVDARVRLVEERYQQPALVEEFLTGREFTVAILGNGPGARALPPVEIRFDSLPQGAPPVYGWEAKWVWDTPEAPLSIFDCPAHLSLEMEEEISGAALGAFHALGCRDWARVDVRLDASGRANVLEVNPLPGILPDPEQNSCYPKASRAAGLNYQEMILAVLDVALERLGMPSPEPAAATRPGRGGIADPESGFHGRPVPAGGPASPAAVGGALP